MAAGVQAGRMKLQSGVYGLLPQDYFLADSGAKSFLPDAAVLSKRRRRQELVLIRVK
ncbi:Uncharacterised protein [uncultured archaeon]|nr:Uncharacterised protein [uncultured archaeon]